MDLDPVGADLSGESQLDLNPSSGLDPTRQVKYIPTAATSVYPNVTAPLMASVSTGEDLTPRTPRALAMVPVIGQNVATEPPDLNAPRPAQLAQAVPSAPMGPRPYQPAPQLQQPQPVTPGIGQGLLGSNRTPYQPYNPEADNLEIARQNEQARVQRLESFANNPLMQLFYKSQTDKAADEAVQKRMHLNEVDKAIQAQKDIQAKAANSGLQVAPTATDSTIVEGLVKDMLGGDPVKAAQAENVLTARGHADLVKGYQSQAVAAIEGTIKYRQDLQDQLDTAKTDEDYNRISKQIKKEAEKAGVNVPKSLGEWERDRAKRMEAGRQALNLIDQQRQLRANQSDYTPEANKDLAASYAGKATYSTNEPMHNAKGVKHEGNLSNGGQAPTGSHILRDYGRTWNTFDEAAREEIEKRTEAVFPKTEREKSINLGRAISMATTDPKTGQPMGPDLINTNPSVRQILIEGITAAARGGAGGTNGNLIKLELAKQGPVQRALDDLITAFAGGKGVLTGKEGEYLSKLTQGQQRYVIDFLQRYNTRNVAERMSTVAERAGMYGAKADELPVEKELQNALEERVNVGRDKQIEHMGRQYRVIGEDNSTFVGTGRAAASVPGAVRTPIPATALPALYPELQSVPPPADTSAPGVGGGPRPGSATTLVPQPGPSGANPFTGGRVAPVPFTPAPAMTAPGPRSEAPLSTRIGNVVRGALGISPAYAQGAPPVPAQLPGSWGAGVGNPAPIAPTVPTPAAPGGPGTSGPPPPVAPQPGSRGGGTFSQGVPSGGFPVHINGNNAARTVYGVAGQTAQNVTSNPVIANNSAIVATSSAQSESAFNPDTKHDNGIGYGLFGHNGDRLAAMRQFAGTKPGETIPPNVQTAFYVREMSKAADNDPFIAQVMRNPNATAEDLTRVQIRMEQPGGYKGPGTEDKVPSWSTRLANTQALMAGSAPATARPVAAVAAPAATAQPSTYQLLNPRTALETLQQRTAPAQPVFQAAPNMAPAVLGTAGALGGGAIAGPPGAVVGGATGGAIGGGIKNYVLGTPEQQTLGGYAKGAGIGAAQGAVAGIPGVGPVATATRTALGGLVPGFEAYLEGKNSGEIFDAAAWGAGGAAAGEIFSRGLGAAGHALFSSGSGATQKELMSVGKTLAQEQPKVMDPATGKMVENAVYSKAVARAKQLGQEPDNLAHAWTTTEATIAKGGIPPTKGEALSQRPGQVGQVQAGRQLEDIKQQIAAAPKPAAVNAPQFKYDPVALVGTPEVPKQFMKDAVAARNMMNQKANSWGEIWGNVTRARTDLLTKQRESYGIQGPGRQEAINAYTVMADHVRKQQEDIARRLLPAPRADALIQHLERASNSYRKAVMAGGDDIIATIAKGGAAGRETKAAINELTGNDVAAKQMTDALIRLHKFKGEGTKIGAGGVASYLAAMHLPGIGPAVATVAGGYSMVKGLKLLNALWAARGSGSTATFNDLARRPLARVVQARRGAAGAALGSAAGLPVGQAVGLAEPAQ